MSDTESGLSLDDLKAIAEENEGMGVDLDAAVERDLAKAGLLDRCEECGTLDHPTAFELGLCASCEDDLEDAYEIDYEDEWEDDDGFLDDDFDDDEDILEEELGDYVFDEFDDEDDI